ncbi:hypothetical protein C8R43DRAFT_1039635 [Mycena crocata]|nr:hypothetical protein C8R43DRAFT_1039635 [Mycena crocata]
MGLDLDLELAYPDDEPSELPPPQTAPTSVSTEVGASASSGALVSAPYTPLTPSHSQSPSAPTVQRMPLPRRTPRPPGAPAQKGPAKNNVKGTTSMAKVNGGPKAPPKGSGTHKWAPTPTRVPSNAPALSHASPHAMPVHPGHSMHAMPPHISMPMVPAMGPPAIPCATKGCGGTAPSAGRRCLPCVRGSWAERGKEEKPRVTIKLKVPKLAAGKAKEKAGEGSADKKGKGKAVEALVNTNGVLEPEVEKPSPQLVDEKGKGRAIESVESSPKDGANTDVAAEVADWDGGGWDSDLTDLTDSDDGTEVEKVVEPPRPSFKIRIPARTPSTPNTSPAKPKPASALPTPPASAAGTPEGQRFCTIARCRAPLPDLSLYRWKCCSPCRKLYREYQRERLARLAAGHAAVAYPIPAPPPPQDSSSATAMAPPPPPPPRPTIETFRAQAKRKEWEREENRRALEATTTWSIAGALQLQKRAQHVDEARLCAGRACQHILPGESEYSWKMCGGCRGRERRKAERALVKEGKIPAKVEDPEKEMEDFPLAPVQRPGRCMYADCGSLMPVDPKVSASECEQCLRRNTQLQQRKPTGRPTGSRNKPKLESRKSNPKTTAPEKPLEVPRKRKRVSPYPAYQSRDALLTDFGSRFRGFIQAQEYYFLVRGGTGATLPPGGAQAMFDFSGEYSVVALDLDVVTRKAEVEVGVHSVKDAVAQAGGLEFSPTSWVSILGKPGGIVTRFACVHLVNVYLPIRAPPGHPHTNPAHSKSMQGELEIAVLPDDSHPYFAGEKTIVRFRLVG